jgi:hypothetical protein
MSRRVVLAMTVVVLCLVAGGVPAARRQLSVYLNGKLMNAQAIDRNGVVFVPLRAVAEALGASVRFESGAVYLDAAPVAPSQSREAGVQHNLPAPQQTPVTGTIRGVVTYYFNVNFGDRPDTGAEAVLFKDDAAPPYEVVVQDEYAVELVDEGRVLQTSSAQGASRYQVVRVTSADGNGNFVFEKVPPGKYVVVIESRHIESRHGKGPGVRGVLGRWGWVRATVQPDGTCPDNPSWRFIPTGY